MCEREKKNIGSLNFEPGIQLVTVDPHHGPDWHDWMFPPMQSSPIRCQAKTEGGELKIDIDPANLLLGEASSRINQPARHTRFGGIDGDATE